MDDFNIVAAIDFGTALSGCAYSTRKDFKDDKLLINCQKQCWNQYDSMNQDMVKTATCILLHKTKDSKHLDSTPNADIHILISKKKTNTYSFPFQDVFIQQQVPNLIIKQVPLHKLQVEDVRREDSRPAEELVSLSIKALKDSLINEIKETGKYPETDLKSDGQTFQIIDFFLALEPEAASVYCNILKTERPEQISEGFRVAEPGTQFVVLDIGGGTTDITVLQKLENGTLRQLTTASGGDVGE
ncbi:unnamed protein product [Mytilus edulis]|uniref:Uncharacterized protein n=1 Tax=Mytilus edulis TaxID=6550 RepID=A0A8S3TLP4_MYTED|nr:unnamed protein product [Mytilus edulis]